MQYLLSQEEFDELKAKAAILDTQTVAKIQSLCTKVAENMPVDVGGKLKPWGCILPGKSGVCDGCPVQEECPYPYKRWSK